VIIKPKKGWREEGMKWREGDKGGKKGRRL